MSEFRYSPEGRTALRRMILDHDGWKQWRTTNSKDSASLSVDDLEQAARDLGIDASAFGRRKEPRAEYPDYSFKQKLKIEGEVEQEKDSDMEKHTVNAEAKLKAMRELLGDDGISEERVLELIKQHAGRPAHITLDLRTPAGVKPLGDKLAHRSLPMLLSAVNAGVPVMLVGPAGSGKTSAAAQVAELLGLDFHFTGALDSPYKLTGFIDAQGRVVETSFRKAFISGGVFLYDEIDGSAPGAVLPFNAALANGFFDFPDGTFKKHDNFRPIAAANTFGRGSDRQYVGRLQQDAAVLDRFAVMSWEYDEALENAIVGAPMPPDAKPPVTCVPILDENDARLASHSWLYRVQAVRAKIFDQKIRHVVSPRATIMGAKLLCAGWPRREVESAILFKGLDEDTIAKIK